MRDKIANAKNDAVIMASVPGSVGQLTEALKNARVAESIPEGDYVRDAYNAIQRLKRARKIRFHHGNGIWREYLKG